MVTLNSIFYNLIIKDKKEQPYNLLQAVLLA